MAIRLVVHDLRMTAGAKHVLEGVHSEAYEAFNQTRNITKIVDQVIRLREQGNPKGPLEVGATLMLPLQPMLAAPCRSVDMAFEKCPNGMCAEIKYDGERVQVHKKGHEFKFFSRSLKPVLPHKVAPFKEFIPKAFPDGSDLILDSEVLMVDCKSGKPLPFGTLGIHKGSGFKDAVPCLFVFDCIYYNGRSLMNEPLKKRKELMKAHMVEVGNHIKFSETYTITQKSELGNLIRRVFQQGLEGLVLKCFKSEYKPGKRHWLKVKKDYLNEGKMADSADLVVLGAWYGTGNKGGLMSVFLMGTCIDKDSNRWGTVTKVHTGHDDKTLKTLQKELQPIMIKIKQNPQRVPDWLNCNRNMVPDFIVSDPQKSPVWEITGAEFTKSAELHTGADGISIRFPRVTRIRNDKTWLEATSADELRELYKVSKEKDDFDVDYSDNTSENTSSQATTDNNQNDDEELNNTSVSQTTDNDEDNGRDKKGEEADDDESGGYSDETDVDEPSPSEFNSSSVPITNHLIDQSWVGRRFNKTHIHVPDGIQIDVVALDTIDIDEEDCIIVPLLRLSKEESYELETDHQVLKKLFKAHKKELIKSSSFTKKKLLYKPKDKSKDCNAALFVNVKSLDFDQLRETFEAIRDEMREQNCHQFLMPVLAKHLNWNAVRTLLKNVLICERWKIRVTFNADNLLKGKEMSMRDVSPKKRRRSNDEQDTTSSSASSSPVKKAKKEVKEDTRNKSGSDTKQNAKDSTKRNRISSDKSEEANESNSTGFDLPNVFNGLIFSLDNLADSKSKTSLRRLLIAYGGDVVDFKDGDENFIDYRVVESEVCDERHVTVNWVRSCIKQRIMLPIPKQETRDSCSNNGEGRMNGNGLKSDNCYKTENGPKNGNGSKTEKNVKSDEGRAVSNVPCFELEELQGDLFAHLDEDTSVVHCISADCKMSKGFAKIVRDNILGARGMKEMVKGKVGDIIPFKMNSKAYLYNLVTKEKYYGKPTYDTLKASLCAMRDHVLTHKVCKLAMPKIGCGLDRLEWPRVKKVLEEVFTKHSVKIQVFHL